MLLSFALPFFVGPQAHILHVDKTLVLMIIFAYMLQVLSFLRLLDFRFLCEYNLSTVFQIPLSDSNAEIFAFHRVVFILKLDSTFKASVIANSFCQSSPCNKT